MKRSVGKSIQEGDRRRFARFLVFLYLLFGFSLAYSHLRFGAHQTKALTQAQIQLSAELEPTPPVTNERLNSKPDQIVAQQIGYSLKLPVLMYHYVRDGVPRNDKLGIALSVTPAIFEAQMGYLATNGYYPITPQELALALKNKTILPPKSLILTFDDGYRDFYTNAYPVLKKYQFRATVFMIVDSIGWPAYLTAEQLKEMQASGLVDIESHTLSHANLTLLSLERAREEIFASKTKLEAFLGKSVGVFCYPYGAYNREIAQLVSEAGYSLAFGTRSSQIEAEGEIFYLPRVRIDGLDSLTTFSQKISIQ